MCPGKVPCGVAWDQSRFRPRTAEKSTAGDPVTLNACANLRVSRHDAALSRPPTRCPRRRTRARTGRQRKAAWQMGSDAKTSRREYLAKVRARSARRKPAAGGAGCAPGTKTGHPKVPHAGVHPPAPVSATRMAAPTGAGAPRSLQVETVGVHDLRPGRDEVLHELFPCCRPGHTPRRRRAGSSSNRKTRSTRSRSTRWRRSCDRRWRSCCARWASAVAHVGEIDEEVVRQRTDAIGEDAVLAAAVVGAEHAHATDQHRHLRRGQAEQLGAVEQHLLGLDHVVLLLPVAEAVMRGSSTSKDSTSVCACVASPRPGANGTSTLKPAALIACSRPTLPPSTITSATLAPVSVAIFSYAASTLARRAGSLPSQSFCGARRMRAPLAPPGSPSRGRCGRCPTRWRPSRLPTGRQRRSSLSPRPRHSPCCRQARSCQIRSSAGTSGPGCSAPSAPCRGASA